MISGLMETFYDGYVVNAILDTCYRSAKTKQWEPVELDPWHADEPTPRISIDAPEIDGCVVIKEERMSDNKVKRILKNKITGEVTETVS